jgi:hypothetical protein
MRTTLRIACFAGVVVTSSLVALAQQTTPDPELAKFREAYTSGDGLAYVVMRDEKGERTRSI